MKKEMYTPQSRLEYFIKEVFKTKTEFARLMDMRPSDLQKYIGNGNSVFSSEEKYRKLSNLGLNMNWYKIGEGEMLAEKNQADPITESTVNNEYERLEAIAEKYYGSINNMAVQCGISANVLYMYKNKRNFGFKLYDILKNKCNINPEFLRTGTGPELIPDTNNKSAEPSAIYNIDLANYVDIEFVNIPAHANVGSFVDFQDLPTSIQKLSLSFKNIDPKNLKGIRVSGDSMAEARIFDGDMAIYDTSKTPKNHDEVVIIVNNMIMIKRYFLKNNVIELHSAYNGIPSIILNEMDDNYKILGVVRAVVSYR